MSKLCRDCVGYAALPSCSGSRFMIPSQMGFAATWCVMSRLPHGTTSIGVLMSACGWVLVSQILNSLRRVGRFNEAEALLRPIIGCQQTLQYRNKTEVHSTATHLMFPAELAGSVFVHHAFMRQIVLHQAAACSEVDADRISYRVVICKACCSATHG